MRGSARGHSLLLVFSSPIISGAPLGNDVHGSRAFVKLNSSPQTLLMGVDCIMPLVTIPLEIVEYIIQIIVAKYPIGSLGAPRNLRSLSLTCHSIRHLVLRAYLRDLAILTQWQWEGMLRLSSSIKARYSVYYQDGGLCWTKTLTIPSTCIALLNAHALSSLARLLQLTVDFTDEGLSTQHTRLKLIASNLASRSLTATHDQLTALTLTSMPRIDTSMLHLISRCFPLLVDLYISCTERLEDAWWCFEDSAGCTIHSPIPYVYADETHLATAFSHALKPLTNLSYLHLGIYLSDEDLLNAHSDEYHLSTGDEDPYGAVSGIAVCPYCLRYAERVRQREIRSSMLFAQNLKALRCVGWSSLFDNSIARSSATSPPSATCAERHTARPTIDRLSTVVWLDRVDDGRIQTCVHAQ
ncbi:uncharacterized protein SCHCODRAFT_02224258 [Schizophyllum commune H4-8]|nr:uncharacterized protein SCHCODRAFT_02224258 [Schizophyllum commune H4-8]KAI5895128.1 hypothetical protein SCHCODRAFT_02224258 [Schizophyllum commune H4-8]